MSLRAPGPLGPYRKAVAVTPSDTTRFDACDALVCTSAAGNVEVIFEDGSSVVLPIEKGFDVRAPLRCIGVKAGATATGLFALYV